MGRKKEPENSELPAIPAPAHLSDRAKALWAAVVPRRARSPERLALLQAGLEALDRAEAARVAVNEQGMTTTTKTTGATHVHPLLKIEREARAQFMSAWTALNLTWDSSLDGRGLVPVLS